MQTTYMTNTKINKPYFKQNRGEILIVKKLIFNNIYETIIFLSKEVTIYTF